MGPACKKAAELAAVKIAAALAAGESDPTIFQIGTSAPPPTFAPIANAWLAHHSSARQLRPASATLYRARLTSLVTAFGDQPLSALTPAAIEDYLVRLREGGSVRFPGKGLSDRSLASTLQVLRLVMKYALRRALIATDPTAIIEWRRTSGPVALADPFTANELHAILTAARSLDADFATALELWMRTGLRAGEWAGLQPRDLDLDTGVVHVQRQWNGERGYGPPKTATSTRVVSFGHPILEGGWRPQRDIVAAMGQKLRGLKRTSMSPEGHLFTNPSGLPWGSPLLSSMWRRAVTKARTRYRPAETLRHSFASALLSANSPLLYTQKAGGWSTAAVLLRTYAKWLPSFETSIEAAPLDTPTHLPATPAQLRPRPKRGSA